MKFNSRTITLTTNSLSKKTPFAGFIYDFKATELKAKAIAILLGKYNKYGRNINIDEYKKIQEKFDDTVFEIVKLLEKN